MTFDVEVLLKDTDRVVTETVSYDGHEPAAWTDDDVSAVLETILLAVDEARNPGAREERSVSLRGLSWIVAPFEQSVTIAIEIPSGAAVAGPFAIGQDKLTTMIARILAVSASDSPRP